MEKIGIIDLGSNSARLVIVDLFADNHFMVVDELKESVRLGQDMERDGFLKPQRVAETIRMLKMFPKGIVLEIGGGATKIVYYNRRCIINYVTLPFGAVTLTGLFADDGLKPEEIAKKIEEFFTEQLKQIEWINTVDPDAQMIGVGGSFRNLFKISKMVHKYPLDIVHGYTMTSGEFDKVYDMIKVLDIDKKKKIKGLSAERADILPAALAIIKSFVSFFGFEKFMFSGSGLREGIMFNQALPLTEEKPISDVLNYSLTTLVKYYGCDVKHVEHVVNLSIQLFKQLRVLHKFPRQFLKVLKVAATLHDCGQRIKFYNHQRHSCYIILNAALYGVSHRDIVLAAFTACCHKKEDINLYEWSRYKDILQEDDIEIVKRLGIMLRIAESLDRAMSGTVKSINCDILGDSVIMKTEVDGDASLEIREAMRASGEFKRAFHKNLEIL